ncbi:MAG: hypothetical protein WBH51_18265, partial [Mycolicibacter algericus]
PVTPVATVTEEAQRRPAVAAGLTAPGGVSAVAPVAEQQASVAAIGVLGRSGGAVTDQIEPGELVDDAGDLLPEIAVDPLLDTGVQGLDDPLLKRRLGGGREHVRVGEPGADVEILGAGLRCSGQRGDSDGQEGPDRRPRAGDPTPSILRFPTAIAQVVGGIKTSTTL